ncbi:hypothetical protein N7457_001290 [Penicillium paradoxum]|uniref:uncharacterized protein n=1 Tax=Penicillium paradoxum TaxID=176176 RepID=UPI00254857F7|nr:uncharacterized protein N7457_001290 [Penicillium paradoxum]KAJ5794691.1 hypothetical protein N7457_001290 [Penicillium paradoxum]
MTIEPEYGAQSEPNAFPNTLLFQQLIELANHHRLTGTAAFRDFSWDSKANHAELMVNVLQLRGVILESLSDGA